MINWKEPKVQEALQGIHDALMVKTVRSGRANQDIILENRIFSILCTDFDLGPTKAAIAMNDRYGYDLTAEDVIQIFRGLWVANPDERKELLQWADRLTDLFPAAVSGNKEMFDRYEKARKGPALSSGRRVSSRERLAAVMLYEKYPQLDLSDESSACSDTDSLYQLGNTMARYFIYDISDVICNVYGYPMFRDSKKNAVRKEPERKLTYEQALRRIEHLESVLDRTNAMLRDIQDEFEEQLAASKVKEQADFFAKLNSEKYGCILDELLVIRKGVDELRQKNYELPIEINGLLIMVKKLIQFIRDNHIEPIRKINSVCDATAADVEFCDYEGTPFSTQEEVKKIKVVSPGWIYKDKQLQIARPKVKEEE